MSGTIHRWTVEDREGVSVCGDATVFTDVEEARKVARQYGALLIEHEYEWQDSAPVEDYSGSGDTRETP